MSASDPIDASVARIRRENKERDRQRRTYFDALCAEWLENRATYMRPEIDFGARGEWEHGEREDELARLITTFPAVYDWMIFKKIEVLEYYLASTATGGTGWTDNREIVMLAGIKADLLRFEPTKRENE
jgi:hypothetical protein